MNDSESETKTHKERKQLTHRWKEIDRQIQRHRKTNIDRRKNRDRKIERKKRRQKDRHRETDPHNASEFSKIISRRFDPATPA